MDNQDQLKDELAKVISDPDTVFFIGSGVSKGADPPLPCWECLLKRVASYCNKQGLMTEAEQVEFGELVNSQARLIDAGGLLQSCLIRGRQTFKNFYEQDELFQAAKPGAIHEKLMKFSPSSVITTNFDYLIEKAYELYQHGAKLSLVTNTHSTEVLEYIATSSARGYIYKYHGDPSLGSVVLGDQEYHLHLMEENRAIRALRGIFRNRNVIFLGTELTDPDVQIALANTPLPDGKRRFRITAGPEKYVNRSARDKYGIDTITYAPDPGHTQILPLLDEIYERAAKHEADAAKLIVPAPDVPNYAAVLQQYEQLQDGDRELRDVIICIIATIGPSKEDVIASEAKRILQTTDAAISRNLSFLAENGILQWVTGRFYPMQTALFDAKMGMRDDIVRRLLDNADEQ